MCACVRVSVRIYIYIYIYIYMRMCVYLPNPTAWAGYDAKSIFLSSV